MDNTGKTRNAKMRQSPSTETESLRLGNWSSKEAWNLAAVAWAAMLLGTALVLEHGFGQAPCALCLTQRAFVLLAGLFVAVGLAHNTRLGIYPLLATLAAVLGGYFSVRHLYLLTLPPEQVPSCGVDFDYLVEAFPLMDILRAMTVGTGECAEQSFEIPALALAGFAAMVAITINYWRMR